MRWRSAREGIHRSPNRPKAPSGAEARSPRPGRRSSALRVRVHSCRCIHSHRRSVCRRFHRAWPAPMRSLYWSKDPMSCGRALSLHKPAPAAPRVASSARSAMTEAACRQSLCILHGSDVDPTHRFLQFGGFRQPNRQNAILELRVQLLLFNLERQAKRARKAAKTPLHVAGVGVPFLTLGSLFPGNGENVTSQADLDFLFADPRQLGRDHQVLVVLIDVNGRSDAMPAARRRIRRAAGEELLEDPIHLTAEAHERSEKILAWRRRLRPAVPPGDQSLEVNHCQFSLAQACLWEMPAATAMPAARLSQRAPCLKPWG